MFDKLQEVKANFDEMTKRLTDPDVISDQELFMKTSKDHAEMRPVVEKYDEYMAVKKSLEEAKAIVASSDDKDLVELAEMELEENKDALERMEGELKKLLLKKDPYDHKNIFLEIRAGTGGDEASLFAAVLLKMYSRYAEMNGWKVEIVDFNDTGVGGYKEVVALIKGYGAYSKLKFEAGGHRVQRVPETESGGRIHTSACTVAVLPEAEDVDVQIEQKDLRVDVYRAGGAGGQHINTTDSAVRMTHIPTGIVVTCQDERSQIKNREKALKLLKSRILEVEIEKKNSEEAASRKLQVGSGDRSERIRTYNFPQNRVTDHRIKESANLDRFLLGEMEEMIDATIAFDQAERLRESGL
ncbi:peptide chain release factor 1 [Seleniivibrio woodruffii]|uniref:Peptide chain release factor 1 n=1 Tax=Seleniivibrio woodruffii TaxID=1078050 RepID=A0A4R1KD11_9BACT|nr:peptide chain release factor 1 [Seleniivibrio woodruffii]TCK62432.1 peptide chain release factor 1 [Seleniivibrio woodruffii]TVZ34450.1 bacterial peptide chain release factor 1 (bRF-1) [Seleniivibrio woodruffii]